MAQMNSKDSSSSDFPATDVARIRCTIPIGAYAPTWFVHRASDLRASGFRG